MPRPLHEKIRDVAWWGEQVAHATVGAAISCCVNLLGWIAPEAIGPAMCALGTFIGGSAGALREILQNWDDAPEDNDLIDSHIDAWAFLLGAFAVSMSFAF